jgi:type II restriction enzyme
MMTSKQKLGREGERLVATLCRCPKCKPRGRTLRALPQNFRCVDVVCDFCGYLAQVKTQATPKIDVLPRLVLGAAWGPQKARMDAGIFFPLYLVLRADSRRHAIYYLSADLQSPAMFVPRRKLSSLARRAGWQGFYYDLLKVAPGAIVRLA